MSADTDNLIMVKGLEEGAAFYLNKPVSRDSLDRLWQFAISWNTKRSSSSPSSSPPPSLATNHAPTTPDTLIESDNKNNDNNNNNKNNDNSDNVVVPLVNNERDDKSDDNVNNNNNNDTEMKDVGADAGAGVGASTGADAGVGAHVDVGVDAGASTGADADAGVDVGASADSGVGADVDLGVDAGADASVGADADADAGAGDVITIEPRRKRPKMVWTTSLHNIFLEAINKIGVDKAVPKRILELMNVSGLRRENVASHLQKYRIFLKRMTEATNAMQYGVPNNWDERPFRSSFVLNEITFLANNLHLHYQQLMANSPRQGITNGTSTFETGESSTKANNSNRKRNKNSGKTQTTSLNNNQTTQDGKKKRKYTQSCKGKKQENSKELWQEGTSHSGIVPQSNNSEVVNGTKTNNNYVGLRINSNGELVGTLNDTYRGYNGFNDHSKESYNIEIFENSTFSSRNTTNNVVNNGNVDVYVPTLHLDNANQHTTFFGTSHEMVNNYNISDELRQIGIDIHLDQEIFGSGFSLGSYDLQANAAQHVEGVQQGTFANDDIPLDYSFMTDDELESLLLNYNQDGDSNDGGNFRGHN